MEQFGLVTIGLKYDNNTTSAIIPTPIMVHKDTLLQNVQVSFQKMPQLINSPSYSPGMIVTFKDSSIIVSQLVKLTNAREINIFHPPNPGVSSPASNTFFCDDNLNCILFTGNIPSVITKQAIELNAMYPHLIAYSRQMVNDANNQITKEQFEEMIEQRRAELEPPCPPLLSKEEFEECMSRHREKSGGKKHKRRSNKTRKHR